jgi:hypothetical protein
LGSAAASRRVPQARQNRAFPGFGVPQFGQIWLGPSIGFER